MKTGQEAASKQAETTMRAAEAAMKTASDQMEKMACIGRSNMDAMVQSCTIVAKGCEEITKNTMGWVQGVMEQSMTVSKQMLAVKTLRELVDLQSGLMRSWMDNSMAETTKMTEISTRTASQAIAPISQRVNEIVETITQPSKAA
ncbi:MAG: phasin family protein [Alphaproteobacteria bacterium]